MKNNKTIVIGSGIAGIATAIRLRAAGAQVKVFEANTCPGGKLSSFSEQGYRFDMGPSLFTMPQFVEELFECAGKPIESYFSYKKKEVVCHYFYEDGTTFCAKGDPALFAKQAAKTFDVKEETILAYLSKSKLKYDLTAPLFLEKSLHKAATYLSKDTIRAICRVNSLDLNTTLAEYNESVFKDDRLVQFYNRFATYNGSSPYLTPGIMSMIPHLEQYFGTYFPKGGMQSITASLYQLAQDIGVEFNFNSKVEQILTKEKKVTGVLVKGRVVQADVVVSNSDVFPTYKQLLKKRQAPEKTLAQTRSSSALIFYWGITKQFPQLDLHNIFFSQNYAAEFDALFKEGEVYHDPTVYVNISSKEEITDAPKGHENWFTMINVPANSGQDWEFLIKEARTNILKKLSRILKQDVEELIDFERILDPRSIQANTQSHQGALYGSSSNNKFAAFLRHPNFTNAIQNLYFCGGSVHPGGGIPLCLLSGKIVSDLVINGGS